MRRIAAVLLFLVLLQGCSKKSTDPEIRDTSAPAATIDLVATTPTTSSISFTWTAAGDDGEVGTASQVIVGYYGSFINETIWNEDLVPNIPLVPKISVPAPKPGGEKQTFELDGLLPSSTYYIALKTQDEAGNLSTLSNVITTATSAPPDTMEVLGTYYLSSEASSITASGNQLYVSCGDAGMKILNIADPASPIETGSLLTPDRAFEISVSGGYAFIADGNAGLVVANVSNPATPAIVGSCDLLSYTMSITVHGNFAFLSGSSVSPGIEIVNIANPSAPTKIGYYNTGSVIHDIIISDTLAFVIDVVGLRVLNVSNPAAPRQIGFLSLSCPKGCPYDPGPRKLAYAGGFIYMAGGEWGEPALLVIRATNPSSPQLEGRFVVRDGYFSMDLALLANKTYFTTGSGIYVLDCSDPSHPTLVAYTNISGSYTSLLAHNDYIIRNSGTLLRFLR